MATPIRMPMPGQMTEECTVLQWFKAEGDSIAKGDPLFEIETDKSNMEIEAFDEGTLLRIDAPEGTTVPVESIVAWIGEPGDELPEPVAAAGRPSPSPSQVGTYPSQPECMDGPPWLSVRFLGSMDTEVLAASVPRSSASHSSCLTDLAGRHHGQACDLTGICAESTGRERAEARATEGIGLR